MSQSFEKPGSKLNFRDKPIHPFPIDRSFGLDATYYQQDGMYVPRTLVAKSISNDTPPAGQKWTAAGQPRSPFLISTYDNQLLFTPYGSGTQYLYASEGRFYRQQSVSWYISNESSVYRYQNIGGSWLYLDALGPTLFVRYGTYGYSIVDIYTDATFSTVYTSANVTVDES